jgi:hypothetical protein
MKYLPLLGALAAFPLISAECIGKNCSTPQVKGYTNRLPEKFNATNPANLAYSPDVGGEPATNARDSFIRASVKGKSPQEWSDEELDNFGSPHEDNSEVLSHGNFGGNGPLGKGNSTKNQGIFIGNSTKNQGSFGLDSITVPYKKKIGSKLPNDMCFAKDYQVKATRGYTAGQIGDKQYVLGNPNGKGWGYEYSKVNGSAYVGQYNKTTRDGKGYLFFLDSHRNRHARFAEYDKGKLVTSERVRDNSYWNATSPNDYLRTLMEHMIKGEVLDNHRQK